MRTITFQYESTIFIDSPFPADNKARVLVDGHELPSFIYQNQFIMEKLAPNLKAIGENAKVVIDKIKEVTIVQPVE